jgi:drug/metabolite transporter (DMT)-like permease
LIEDKPLLTLVILEVFIFSLANFLVCQAIQNKGNNVVVGFIESCYPFYALLFTYFLFHRNHLTWSTGMGGLFIITGLTLISRV